MLNFISKMWYKVQKTPLMDKSFKLPDLQLVYLLGSQELTRWETAKVHPTAACHREEPAQRVLWKQLRREQGMTCLQILTISRVGISRGRILSAIAVRHEQLLFTCQAKYFQPELLPQHPRQWCHGFIRLWADTRISVCFAAHTDRAFATLWKCSISAQTLPLHVTDSLRCDWPKSERTA